MTDQSAVVVEAGARSRARLWVLALITGATMLNYLDRAVLGVAAPALTAGARHLADR